MSWKVTDIVQAVQKRTEHRADTKIDMRMEFFLGLDEFVQESPFWWTKKRANFTTVIGSQVYDFTLSVASGGVQPAGGITDFGQLDEMILLEADGVTKQLDLTPIIDSIGQLQAINNNVQGTPAAYFIDVNTSLTTLYFQAPSNVAQKVLYTYRAIPQISDISKEDIPLVPGGSQWGLVYMLERRVYEFLYGQDDPRWQVSNARYQEFLKKASRIQHWSGKKVREASANASTLNIVRAGGGQ